FRSVPDRQRVTPTPPERIDERRRWRLSEETDLTGSRPVDDGSVLGDHPVEDLDLGKDALQVLDLATGDEDQPAAGRREPPQRLGGLMIDRALRGQRAVVVGRESEIALARHSARP